MFPEPMSRFALRPEESPRDPSHALEQNILAGFPPDLALDLVLNELAVRAAEATRASAAAVALVRGDEMVCRAATGRLAPGLGIPLNPRDGLSGACLQSRQPQLSIDTASDPRVDSGISRRLGIRSILAVPVFDINDNAKFTGVLEVFSTSPAAFSNSDQKLLEGFAEECARIQHAALELDQRNPIALASTVRILPALVPSDLTPSDLTPLDLTSPDLAGFDSLPAHHFSYETWVLVLGALTILATVALGLLIGSRIGWLGSSRVASSSHIEQPAPEEQSSATAADPQANQALSGQVLSERSVSGKSSEKGQGRAEKASGRPSPTSADAAGDLVVYEKGKVVFRMKSTPAKQISDAVTEASSTAQIAPAQSIWLDPEQAEARLLRRTEPQYPPAAVAAHRAGDVILEVQVADDGSVSNIRTLSGDPLLATAATEAVRNWRYQPYRQHDQPAQFQTDVTLTFALPN
jgi:TonB family protein